MRPARSGSIFAGSDVKRETHPDRRAGVVLVFDLGLGQRGAVLDAPVHRLEALVDVAVVQELDEAPAMTAW